LKRLAVDTRQIGTPREPLSWSEKSLPMRSSTMAADLAKNWWAFAVRGIAGITFGLSALFWPPRVFVARVLVFAAYALVDGILNLVAATPADERGTPSIPIAIEGAVSLIAGVVIMEWPEIAGFPLVALIAAWSILRGTAEGLAALRLRKHGRERLLVLAGLLSLVGGLLAFSPPVDGVSLVTIWVGAYAVVFGGVMIGLSLRLRTATSLQRGRPGQRDPGPSGRMGVLLRIADYRPATGSAHLPNASRLS